MPKLPHISGAQAVKIFEHLGFVVMRQNGSHIILRKGSTGCVVPNHKEIKVGTLAGILRQAGVSADEFLQAIHD